MLQEAFARCGERGGHGRRTSSLLPAFATEPAPPCARDHRGRRARLRRARLPRCDDPGHRRRARHQTGESLLLFPLQGGGARARLPAGCGRFLRGGEGNCVGTGRCRRQAHSPHQITPFPAHGPQQLCPGVLERAPAPAGRKPPADRKVVARTGAGVRRRRQGRGAAWRVSRRPRYPPGGSRHPRHGQRGGELVPQRGGGDRPHQRRVRPPYRRRREDAAEAALPPKACAAVRALIPADEAKFWYMRRRLRLTTPRSFAGTPARIAAPFGVRRTTTSRLLVADRVRVTRPIFTRRVTTRDKVETSMLVLAATSIWRWPSSLASTASTRHIAMLNW